jgi:dienelactone hydrolase
VQKTPEDAGPLTGWTAAPFTAAGQTHDVFTRGSGPGVVLLPEIPGMTPEVMGLADHLVAQGFTVAIPSLFGQPGRAVSAGYALPTFARACITREFQAFARRADRPVAEYVRALARDLHGRAGGPGVGVVGMCFTGGFALAMAVDPVVVAPVLSQPSMPFPVSAARRRGIDCDDADLDAVARRCAADGLRVLGLRFEGDPLVPAERFAFLRERLGDGFVGVELPQSAGHPDGPLRRRHSVLTADLVDAPGEPTRAALDQVLDLFAAKLVSG